LFTHAAVTSSRPSPSTSPTTCTARRLPAAGCRFCDAATTDLGIVDVRMTG
jgi:hypothetical protein